jgi:hypothetical protein
MARPVFYALFWFRVAAGVGLAGGRCVGDGMLDPGQARCLLQDHYLQSTS